MNKGPIREAGIVKVLRHTRFTDSCWLFEGWLQRGYGLVRNGKGRKMPAHRTAYEFYIGPVPDGLCLDHLCRVRNCVNPAHLEPVTVAENNRRGLGWSGRNVAKTHCPQGHPYDDQNTIRLQRGGRRCRACNREQLRAYRVRRAAVAA